VALQQWQHLTLSHDAGGPDGQCNFDQTEDEIQSIYEGGQRAFRESPTEGREEKRSPEKANGLSRRKQNAWKACHCKERSGQCVP
jgi:hypothetical protein